MNSQTYINKKTQNCCAGSCQGEPGKTGNTGAQGPRGPMGPKVTNIDIVTNVVQTKENTWINNKRNFSNY